MSPSARVALHPTTLADLPRICEWERHPDNAAFVQVWSIGQHRSALVDPTMRHLVIETGGTAVGFVILAGVTGTRPVIEFRRIVVMEKGRGLGKAAVHGVLQLAFRELDATEVWLDFVAHNDRARHVYTSSGFRIEPAGDLLAVVGGKPTPLVKMTMSQAEFDEFAAQH